MLSNIVVNTCLLLTRIQVSHRSIKEGLLTSRLVIIVGSAGLIETHNSDDIIDRPVEPFVNFVNELYQ